MVENPHLVINPCSTLADDLLAAAGSRDFFSDVLEKRPLHGCVSNALSYEVNELLEDSRELAKLGKMFAPRFVFIERPLGVPGNEIPEISGFPDITLNHLADWFAKNTKITLAIQHLESKDSRMRAWMESIGNLLKARIESTVFLSPPNSATSTTHYDTSDAFAIQLAGSKRWEIYEPIDLLPNFKTPYKAINQDKKELTLHSVVELKRGDFLYLPRGWIHKVENVGASISIHLSLSVYFNSWIEIFQTLLLEAYGDVRDQTVFRERVSLDRLNKGGSRAELLDLYGKFESAFKKLMAEQISQYADHCTNLQSDKTARQAATVSFADVTEDATIVRSGASFSVKDVDGNCGLSVDGSHFYIVSRSLAHYVLGRESVTLKDLECLSRWSEAEIIRFLEIAVKRLGAWKIVPPAG